MVSAIINHNYNSAILNLIGAKENGIEENQFDYIIIRRNPEASEQNSSSLFQWFAQSGFVTNLDFSSIPADKVFQKERFTLKFTLAGKFSAYFALLRGLLEFRKPSGLIISADRSDKSFAVEFTADSEEKSIAFFETIFQWLSKEIRFKEVLKEVIRFDQKIKGERALLASSLYSSLRK